MEHPYILLSSVVFVFSVNAMTGCIFYTSVMSKIPFVILTNVACCYAHKFNSMYILAHQCGQDSIVVIVTAMGWTVWGLNPGGSDIFHTSPYQP